DPRAIPSPLVGRPASAFAVRTFDGRTVTLDSLRGQVVVLNFWASWCYPACYEEAPALEAGWRRYRERGVTVLGVAIQDDAAASRGFIERFGLSFPNAPDPGGKLSIEYGVYGVPESFVIHRRGAAAGRGAGMSRPPARGPGIRGRCPPAAWARWGLAVALGLGALGGGL